MHTTWPSQGGEAADGGRSLATCRREHWVAIGFF